MLTTNTTWCARVLLVLFSLTVVATSAQAVPIDYTITFTITDGGAPAPTSGAFTYDADVPLFTNFHVLWNGVDFDVTAVANAPSFTDTCSSSASGPALGFAVLSGLTGCASEQLWYAFSVESSDSSALFFYSSSQPFTPSVGNLSQAAGMVLEWFQSHDGDARVGGTFTIAPATAAVPEPTSLVLLASGVAGLLLRRRRRTA